VDAKLIFDASTKPFPWVIVWSPLVGCAIAGAAILLEKTGRLRKSRFTRLSCFFAIIAGMVSAIYFQLVWFHRHREVARLFALGYFDSVQGVVTDFRPENPDRSSNETFTIAGHKFAYSSESFITPCFNQTALQQGPIQAGMLLRIKFTDDCILQIEDLDQK
jgi:hypothetical protein